MIPELTLALDDDEAAAVARALAGLHHLLPTDSRHANRLRAVTNAGVAYRATVDVWVEVVAAVTAVRDLLAPETDVAFWQANTDPHSGTPGTATEAQLPQNLAAMRAAQLRDVNEVRDLLIGALANVGVGIGDTPDATQLVSVPVWPNRLDVSSL